MSFEEFKTDRMRQSAVIREFEIIGESVGKLPDELKMSSPDVAWQDIKAFHNLLVHEYFGVDLEIVWQVLQADLPALIRQVEVCVENGNNLTTHLELPSVAAHAYPGGQ